MDENEGEKEKKLKEKEWRDQREGDKRSYFVYHDCIAISPLRSWYFYCSIEFNFQMTKCLIS